jgi:hypothetical protein
MPQTNARAVEAQAGEVLDFLIHFLDEQRVPYLKGEAEKAEAQAELDSAREGLRNIESFVRERMNRLGGELKDVANRTVQCPDCEQLALVLRKAPDGVEGADLATCHFCSRVWDTEELLGYFNEHGQEEPTEWNTCRSATRGRLGWASEYAVIRQSRSTSASPAPSFSPPCCPATGAPGPSTPSGTPGRCCAASAGTPWKTSSGRADSTRIPRATASVARTDDVCRVRYPRIAALRAQAHYS